MSPGGTVGDWQSGGSHCQQQEDRQAQRRKKPNTSCAPNNVCILDLLDRCTIAFLRVLLAVRPGFMVAIYGNA